LHSVRIPFRPIRDDPQDVPDVSALTGGRAGTELVFVEAVPGAVVATGLPFRENRTGIEIPERFHPDRKGPFAGMVEQKKPGFEPFEMDLVTEDFNFRVREKAGAGGPPGTAIRTLPESRAFRCEFFRKGRWQLNTLRYRCRR
jgi:hypothetical protein